MSRQAFSLDDLLACPMGTVVLVVYYETPLYAAFFSALRDDVVYWKTKGKINNDLQCN